MNDKQFLNVFSGESWIQVPRVLLQNLGAVPAIVLCYIIDKAKYHKSTTIWFDNIELAAKLCGVPSRHIFMKGIEKLEEQGLITSELKGVPARKYFTIIKDAVILQFDKTLQTELETSETPVSQTIEKQFVKICETALENNAKLSNNTTTNKTTNNNRSAKADKVFINYISDEFIPNYPKVVPVKRIWTQVTELTKEFNNYTVEQYEDLCGKIRKHLVAYVKSTEKKFLLAPDNYLAARKWQEDIGVSSAKSSKNGAMNDKVNNDYLDLLKQHGL